MQSLLFSESLASASQQNTPPNRRRVATRIAFIAVALGLIGAFLASPFLKVHSGIISETFESKVIDDKGQFASIPEKSHVIGKRVDAIELPVRSAMAKPDAIITSTPALPVATAHVVPPQTPKTIAVHNEAIAPKEEIGAKSSSKTEEGAPRLAIPSASPVGSKSSASTLPRVFIGKGASKENPFPPPSLESFEGDKRPEAYPLGGFDLVDEPTRMVEAIDPQTPAADADPYDRPEDADKLAKKGSIWEKLVRKYKNAPIEVLANPSEPAMCLISAVYTRNCKYLDESFEECILRYGVWRLEPRLSHACFQSKWYKQTTASMPKGVPNPPSTQRGRVPASEVCAANRTEIPFKPPSERSIPPMGPPRVCRNGALHYPATFGTPFANMQLKPLPKLFDFNPIHIGSNARKYFGFNDEDTLQALAALSYFCLTQARGGWDCGRHYEIMGAGCVPYFYDIPASGPYILPQFPKKLFRDIIRTPMFSHIGYVKGANGDSYFYENHTNYQEHKMLLKDRVQLRNEPYRFRDDAPLDKAWYWSTARKLLRYTHKYLTSEAQAAYLLHTMGIAETAKRIMAFTPGPYWDNMQQSMLTGFDALGIQVTIVNGPRANLYKCLEENPNEPLTNHQIEALRASKERYAAWGNGHPWAHRMHGKSHTFIEGKEGRELALSLIAAGYFDAVFYLTYDTTSDEELAFVARHVNGKVAITDGQDSLNDPRYGSVKIAKNYAYFFSRELRSLNC